MDVQILMPQTLILKLQIMMGRIYEGCTDENACNYNSFATNDDGSCEYLSCAGCTMKTMLNTTGLQQ